MVVAPLEAVEDCCWVDWLLSPCCVESPLESEDGTEALELCSPCCVESVERVEALEPCSLEGLDSVDGVDALEPCPLELLESVDGVEPLEPCSPCCVESLESVEGVDALDPSSLEALESTDDAGVQPLWPVWLDSLDHCWLDWFEPAEIEGVLFLALHLGLVPCRTICLPWAALTRSASTIVDERSFILLGSVFTVRRIQE